MERKELMDRPPFPRYGDPFPGITVVGESDSASLALFKDRVREFIRRSTGIVENARSLYLPEWTTGVSCCFGDPTDFDGKKFGPPYKEILQSNTFLHNYKVPVYISQSQLEGTEYHIPPFNWQNNAIIIDGEKYCNIGLIKNPDEALRKRVRDIPASWNNYQEEYGMYKDPAMDSLIKNNGWHCPIILGSLSGGVGKDSVYSLKENYIRIPRKYAFNIGFNRKETYISGQRFYKTLFHEMAHSNQLFTGLSFGHRAFDRNYDRSEIVAEMTAAVMADILHYDNSLVQNSLGYVKGYLDGLHRKKGDYLLSLSDYIVGSSVMIATALDDERRKLGLPPVLDDKRIALAAKKPYEPSVAVEKDGQMAFFKRGYNPSGTPSVPEDNLKSDTNMANKNYVDVLDKEKDFAYMSGGGRWHGEEQNELRVYQRYGDILRHWDDSTHFLFDLGTIERSSYVRNIPATTADSLPRSYGNIESLMLSINSDFMKFDKPLYLSSDEIRERGLKVLKDSSPVPFLDKATGRVTDYYNVDETNMKAVNPDGYKEAVAKAIESQKEYLTPADKASWQQVYQMTDDEWHCKVSTDTERRDAPARYDRGSDTVFLDRSYDRELDIDDSVYKDALLTSFHDSLIDSGRIMPKSSEPRDESNVRTLSRLMDSIRYDVNLNKGNIPEILGLSSRFDSKDPQYVKDMLTLASKVSDGVTGRALYVSTGVRDPLTEDLLEKGESKTTLRDGVYSARQETPAMAGKKSEEKEERPRRGLGV